MASPYEWTQSRMRGVEPGPKRGFPKRKPVAAIEWCLICEDEILFLQDYIMYAHGYAHEECREFLRLQKKFILEAEG